MRTGEYSPQKFSFYEAVIENFMTEDSRLFIVTCVEVDIHAHLTQPQHQEHVQYQHPDTDQTCHDHQEFDGSVRGKIGLERNMIKCPLSKNE